MWTQFAKRRHVSLDGYLGDIESHLNDHHPYKDSDVMTWAHEGTHGVNSLARNYMPDYNCMYTLDDNMFVAKEPKFLLSTLAKSIPQELRGEIYKTYLLDSQRWWNDCPLYILDELSAYINGHMVGIQLHTQVNSSRLEHNFIFAIEMLGYCAILVKMTKNDPELICFMKYATEGIKIWLHNFNTAQPLYNKVAKYFPYKG